MLFRWRLRVSYVLLFAAPSWDVTAAAHLHALGAEIAGTHRTIIEQPILAIWRGAASLAFLHFIVSVPVLTCAAMYVIRLPLSTVQDHSHG